MRETKSIDSFNYCVVQDEEKEKFYRRHTYTELEKQKTKELMARMEDFVLKTGGEDGLRTFHFSTEGGIHYREGLGYISVVAPDGDRGNVYVYSYGETLEEAFFPAIMDYEFYVSENYELYNRKRLNQQFCERFGGTYSEQDYHGPFFFAELALRDFRKYYGDNIPEEVIHHYEEYLKEVHEGDYQYDYETNGFIQREKAKDLSKKTLEC